MTSPADGHAALPPRLRASYDALRHEVQRLKAQSWEGRADLPGHGELAEDLAAALALHGALSVTVLSCDNLHELEEALGWQEADRLHATATEGLRALARLHAGEPTWLAQDEPYGGRFLLFAPLPPGASAGSLAAVEERTRTLRDDLESWLADNAVPEGRELRLTAGWSVAFPNPALRFERLVNRSVGEARAMSRLESEREGMRRGLELRRILQERALSAVYQPIARLDTLDVIGYEGLVRGPEGTPWRCADHLFTASSEHRLAAELDLAARERVLSELRGLAPGRRLFLNIVPESILLGEAHHERLRERVAAAGLSCSDVVLEVGERARIDAHDDFRRQLDRLRRDGFAVALDDVGSGYASLRLIPELEPEFLKLDAGLVRHVDRSPARQDLLATLVDLSGRLGGEVVCEGIETAGELATVRSRGAHHGQGFGLSRPEARLADRVSLPA